MLLKSVKTSLFITGLFSFVPLTPGLSGVVRQRREARAEARADLRARYLAWREQWRKPELRYGERSREIHQVCRLRKSHIRVQYDDPVLRKLHYHIAEVQRILVLVFSI